MSKGWYQIFNIVYEMTYECDTSGVTICVIYEVWQFCDMLSSVDLISMYLLFQVCHVLFILYYPTFFSSI